MGKLCSTRSRAGTRRVVTIVAALSLLANLAAPSGAYQRPGATERVSVSSTGAEHVGRFLAGGPVSANGRFVAFASDSPLVANDSNLISDIFVRDRKRQATELVSVASSGDPSILRSDSPGMTPDGRYVAFKSDTPNLVPGDTNNESDVFVRDRRNGVTERVSVSSKGDEANGSSRQSANYPPSLSRDGRYVAFASYASNLVKGDTNDAVDVFVHDRKTRVTRRASVNSRGEQAEGGTPPHTAACPSLSAKGRHVAFFGNAKNLSDDENRAPANERFRPWPRIYVRDLKTKKTEVISRTVDGTPSGGTTCESAGRTISGNGRFVMFTSTVSNLVPNDTNGRPGDVLPAGSDDVFVFDRVTHRRTRVSVSSDGSEGGCQSHGGGISADGRFVTLSAHCSPNNSLDDSGAPSGVFVHDRSAGAIVIQTLTAKRKPGTGCTPFQGPSIYPHVSSGGRFVTFTSCYDDLVPHDRNGADDLFVRDTGAPLGVGGLGDIGTGSQEPSDEDDQICVTPDACIPPGRAVSSSDSVVDLDEVLTEQGANLYGASLAYRPQYEDLFAAIELEHMPKVLPGISPIFYGLRFRVADKLYEVRATSLLGGTFGLFDCTTPSSICTNVADLRGGYGTTGMRVVFSLPLEEIGLEEGGELRDVVAFSGLGSYLSGATKVLDTVVIK